MNGKIEIDISGPGAYQEISCVNFEQMHEELSKDSEVSIAGAPAASTAAAAAGDAGFGINQQPNATRQNDIMYFSI